MSITELIQAAQFLVDAAGNKKAVVLDYVYWNEFLGLSVLRKRRKQLTVWRLSKREVLL